jgi:hypothetical protein
MKKRPTKSLQAFRLREDIVALLNLHSEKTNVPKTRLVELALLDYLKKGKSFKKYAELAVSSEAKSTTAKQTSSRLKQMRRAADKLKRLITEVELLAAI